MTRLLVLVVAVLGSTTAPAKEAFDVARFVPPPGWQRAQSPGLLTFQAPIRGGSGALLLLFPSEPARGSPQENFRAAWAKLVAPPLGGVAPAQVKTETTSEGWAAVIGVAPYVKQGATWRALLVTSTGQGRAFSVVAHVLGNQHDAAIDAFFRDLDFVVAGPGAPAAPASAAPPEPVAAAGVGAAAAGGTEVGGMSYTPPRGWTRSTRDGAVVYTSAPYPNNGERCELTILPMRRGGGDLLRDAVGTFQQLFRVDPLGGYPALDPHLTRGTSPFGWQYVTVEKTLGSGGSEGPFIILFEASVGDQIATVFTMSKYSLVSQCFGEMFPSEWPPFFASVRFRGSKPVPEAELRSKLVGSWVATGASVLLRYTLAANGRYQGGSAAGTVSRVSSTEVVYTTTGFRGDGAWSVKDGRFDFTPDNTPPDGGPFRLEQESKDHGRTWKERLCILGKTGEICYRRDD